MTKVSYRLKIQIKNIQERMSENSKRILVNISLLEDINQWHNFRERDKGTYRNFEQRGLYLDYLDYDCIDK